MYKKIKRFPPAKKTATLKTFYCEQCLKFNAENKNSAFIFLQLLT